MTNFKSMKDLILLTLVLFGMNCMIVLIIVLSDEFFTYWYFLPTPIMVIILKIIEKKLKL